MPRIPVLNTKTTINTSVPGMSATPANTASTAALGRVGGIVENIGFAIAEKRQKQQDATAELDFDSKTDEAYRLFVDQNQKFVDDNGQLNGVDFREAAKEAVNSAIEEARENNKSISSDQQFRLDQKAKIKLDTVSTLSQQLQDKIKVERATTKTANISASILDYALTGDLKTTEQRLKSFNNYLANAPESVSKKYTDISDRAYTNAIEGMINKNSFGAADETLKSYGSKLSEKSKLLLQNKIENGRKEYDRNLVSDIKDSVAEIESAIQLGVATPQQASAAIAGVLEKANKVSDKDMVQKYQTKAEVLQYSVGVGAIMDSLPLEKWDEEILKAADNYKSDGTMAGDIAKATLFNNLTEMKTKRIEAVNKHAADHFIKTDGKAREFAKLASTPEGFKNFASYIKNKASSFGVPDADLKIVPSYMKQQYGNMLNSGDASAALVAVNDLKQLTGTDFTKAVHEITDNPNIIVASAIGDQNIAMELLQASKDSKKFNADWEQHLQRNPNKDSKKEITEMMQSENIDEMFQIMSGMGDGKRTLSAYQNAAETIYKNELMKQNGTHSAAVKKVQDAFFGDQGLFDIARHSSFIGSESMILLPRNNKAGVTPIQVERAIDIIKNQPFKALEAVGYSKDKLSKYVSEGSFEDTTFKISQDGNSLRMYGPSGEPEYDSDKNPIIIPLTSISDITAQQWSGVSIAESFRTATNRKPSADRRFNQPDLLYITKPGQYKPIRSKGGE